MARQLNEVVYVDGVRTAFGKAGPGGLFWKTRADDMGVKVVRELLRRNPGAPPERIGDVVMAATAQVGDQGLTLGRDVGLLAGLPHTVPGFAVDRMCAGALTATTAAAGEIAMGACDLAIAGGVEHMGHHPMGEDVDFNPRFVSERLIDESAAVMGQTAENLHDAFPTLTKEAADRYAAGVAAPRVGGMGRPEGRVREHRRPDERVHGGRLEGRRSRRVPPARDDARGPRRAADAVPRGRSRHGRQLGRPHRRRDGSAPRLGDRCRRARARAADAPGRLRVRRRRAPPDGPRPGSGDQSAFSSARGSASTTSGCFELNEPFAVQVLTWCDGMGVAPDDPRLNPYGGAIACGHPLAATGVRLMAQLAFGFERRPDVRYGLTALCIGLGMGAALLWENARHGCAEPVTRFHLQERRRRASARSRS